jgi:hypothetical protein
VPRSGASGRGGRSSPAGGGGVRSRGSARSCGCGPGWLGPRCGRRPRGVRRGSSARRTRPGPPGCRGSGPWCGGMPLDGEMLDEVVGAVAEQRRLQAGLFAEQLADAAGHALQQAVRAVVGHRAVPDRAARCRHCRAGWTLATHAIRHATEIGHLGAPLRGRPGGRGRGSAIGTISVACVRPCAAGPAVAVAPRQSAAILGPVQR